MLHTSVEVAGESRSVRLLEIRAAEQATMEQAPQGNAWDRTARLVHRKRKNLRTKQEIPRKRFEHLAAEHNYVESLYLSTSVTYDKSMMLQRNFEFSAYTHSM